MRLLILDNYDSFTYNLYDYACRAQAGFKIDVIRHDMITLEEAAAYDAFMKIENTSFTIENINFELNEETEDGQQGMGFSEGEIKYDIIFTGGERKKIFGPFKIYFSLRWDCWEICFFYLAGFNYHPANE